MADWWVFPSKRNQQHIAKDTMLQDLLWLPPTIVERRRLVGTKEDPQLLHWWIFPRLLNNTQNRLKEKHTVEPAELAIFRNFFSRVFHEIASLPGTLRLFAIPGFEGDVRAETPVESEPSYFIEEQWKLSKLHISPKSMTIYDYWVTRTPEDNNFKKHVSPNLCLPKEGLWWSTSGFFSPSFSEKQFDPR